MARVWASSRGFLGLLATLALSGCAASAPWPPPAGSCITVAGHKPIRFRLAGQPVTREGVERAIARSDEDRTSLTRGTAQHIAGPVLVVVGDLALLWGLAIAGATGRAPVALVSVGGAALIGTGIALLLRSDEPFRRLVNRFNDEEARAGTCAPRAPPPPAPGEIITPAPGLPTLPSRQWIP